MRHNLIIGGTGMLRQATLALATPGTHTTLISRRPGPLAAALTEAGGSARGVAVDYRDTDALQRVLDGLPTPDLALCWIHSDAPAALTQVTATAPRQVVEVLGSAAGRPDARLPERPAGWQRVVLGWMVEGGRSRWLTHAEISAGVLAAIHSAAPMHVVGTVRPWSDRPGW